MEPVGELYKSIFQVLYDTATVAWPKPVSFGEPNNIFSNDEKPQLLDYIFYRTFRKDLDIKSKRYFLKSFKTKLNKGCEFACPNPGDQGINCFKVCHPDEIPLSDHEPQLARIDIRNVSTIDANKENVNNLVYDSVQNSMMINELQERVNYLESMIFGYAIPIGQ